MATYYITPNSPTVPSLSAGDRVLWKRGEIYSYASQAVFIAQKDGCYFGAYGEGDRPILRITNPTANSQIILIRDSDNITIENLAFDGNNLGHAGVIFQVNTNGETINNNTVNNCEFYNCSYNHATTGVTNYRPGLNIEASNGNAAGSPVTGFSITNNIFHDNWAHGLMIQGHIADVYVGYNKAYRNGKGQGAHNMSSIPNRSSSTGGFSAVSGNIYSLTVSKANIYIVRYNAGATNVVLTKNTSTPTTPGLNEFGYDGTIIYFNIGGNPSAGTLSYTWSECKGIVYEYNECYEGVAYANYAFTEGHGIAMDDYTSECIIRYNYLHDNQGHGISINNGRGAQIYGNIITNNALNGVKTVHDVTIIGNTFRGNKLEQLNLGRLDGAFFANQSNVKFNIIDGVGLYPAYYIDSRNITTDANIIWNHTGIGSYTSTNPINADPLLDPNFVPAAWSPAIGAGYKYWNGTRPLGFNGEPRPDANMDIGAVQTQYYKYHPYMIDKAN